MKDKTIFLIDDDSDDCEIFSLALKETIATYKYVSANNATEALEKLNSGEVKPDYIFLDLNMRPINGRQFLKEIKQKPNLRHIPVVIFSTSSAPFDIDQTRELGAAHFLSKPYSIIELVHLLSIFFRGKDLPFYLNT